MLFALLIACAPSWDGFVNAYPEAACEEEMVCNEGNWDTVDDCVEAISEVTGGPEPEDYDASAAADCLRLLREAGCSDEALAAQYEACSSVGG